VSLALHLSMALRDQILREAEAALPTECCGLIEGLTDGAGWHATALHPSANLSPDPNRFEIDPTIHLQAQRAARTRGTAILGCYHSHPNGRPDPSSRDREGAGETGFLWLIAVPGGALAAYEFDGLAFRSVPLAMPRPATL